MVVRRSRPTSSRARHIALLGVPLLLAMTGCTSGAAEELEPAAARAAVPNVARGDTSTSGRPAPPADRPESPASRDRAEAEHLAQVAIEAVLGPLAPEIAAPSETPNDTRGDTSGDLPGEEPKELEGGGFASAVPGSDAPDRKVDVGPQFAVTDDLDIEEIERLVAAVEKIARQQRVRSPEAVGGSVAAAVGTFGYRWFADGTVRPEPSWVAENIRTETVPILGAVTGHKVMLPQLRGALREVVARGLADEIHPEEFGGCYVPRFIGHDPAKGLSLHTWGIAVDLNVPGNQRGVPGEIDRDVVAIFKKWGFAWGGDWAWTDPMHFELARLVRPR